MESKLFLKEEMNSISLSANDFKMEEQSSTQYKNLDSQVDMTQAQKDFQTLLNQSEQSSQIENAG
jgi:hypothetical protein